MKSKEIKISRNKNRSFDGGRTTLGKSQAVVYKVNLLRIIRLFPFYFAWSWTWMHTALSADDVTNRGLHRQMYGCDTLHLFLLAIHEEFCNGDKKVKTTICKLFISSVTSAYLSQHTILGFSWVVDARLCASCFCTDCTVSNCTWCSSVLSSN